MTDQDQVLDMWVIYDHPTDFPEHFVARRWEVRPLQTVPTRDRHLSLTLPGARNAIPDHLNRVRLDRHDLDDPKIVECWL